MTTLAITGATGFVGKHLAKAALDRGWTVRALVRQPARVPPHPNMQAIAWEADQDTPTDALRGVDAVVHAAAFVPPDLSDPVHADACMAVNAGGTLRLLQATERAGVPRLVYLSSANCYAPSGTPVTEDAPLYPSARAPYYLCSKLAGEVYVAHWSAARRLSACSLRLASVYGPGMPLREVVAVFARNLSAGQEIHLHGGGLQSSDFIHVEDVAEAALAAATRTVAGALNIGAGQQTTIRALAAQITDLLGGDAHRLIREGTGTPPPSGYAGLDVGRAVRELGFRPRPLRDGLERYLAESQPLT
jgi:UDP-glucose 4-epimerase